MSQAPSMPLFCGDYLGDTMHLSLEEHGAYLKLLMVTWQNGAPLPDENARIARMLGVSVSRWRGKLRPVVAEFFDLSGGVWFHARLQKEWDFVQKYRGEQSEKGKRGAAAKSLKKQETSQAAASPELKPSSSTYPFKEGTEEASASSSADAPPEDLKSIVFGRGLKWFQTHTRKTEDQLRRWLGGCCGKYGDATVAATIMAFDGRAPPVDPFSAFTAALQRTAGNGRNGKTDPYAAAIRAAQRLDQLAAGHDDPDPVVALLPPRRNAGVG